MIDSDAPISKRARIRARRSAVQALYQWRMTNRDMREIIDEFERERDLRKTDKEYFRSLLQGVADQANRLDETLVPLVDRPLQEVDPIERAILHIGIYELQNHPEIPWRVVINESVELAKMFGAEQSHRFVNGILDSAAHILRPAGTG
ncbi:MAG: transcription antitermination factor NusB [Gammaproteobacteria bacterium]|nr:transcription antitermination factor NusB [Gammaproteobacteria bacterium]MCI0591694.1 transcription antitermination factor NusB [Gammaproteobacteria bacterium]